MAKIDLMNLKNVQGMSRDQIKEIQRALIDSGYLDRTFQSKFGERASDDGLWGNRSQAALDAYLNANSPKDFSKGAGFIWNPAAGYDPSSEFFSKSSENKLRENKPVYNPYPEGASTGIPGFVEESITKNKENSDNITLSDKLYDDIPVISKATSLIAQIGDHALNQGARVLMGIKENPSVLKPTGTPGLWILKAALTGTAKGNEIADKVESGEAEYTDLYNTSFLGNTSLTNAEKRNALAVLTQRNGNVPVTYESYLRDLEANPHSENGFIGVNQDPYHFSNHQEDRRGMDQKSGAGFLGAIWDTGKRMFHDPNRGRLGSWSYRVTPDGTIEITDRFEGTERVAAKGKNDSENYSLARKLWFRGTTHDLDDNITPEQQQRWYKKANDK